MVENNRKPIASLNMFPQFTTMNVIDGQAGIIIYSSLICYSLTIDNILNIIILLILAGITIATLIGDNGILKATGDAKEDSFKGQLKEEVLIAWNEICIDAAIENWGNDEKREALENKLKEDDNNAKVTLSEPNLNVIVKGYKVTINLDEGTIGDVTIHNPTKFLCDKNWVCFGPYGSFSRIVFYPNYSCKLSSYNGDVFEYNFDGDALSIVDYWNAELTYRERRSFQYF